MSLSKRNILKYLHDYDIIQLWFEMDDLHSLLSKLQLYPEWNQTNQDKIRIVHSDTHTILEYNNGYKIYDCTNIPILTGEYNGTMCILTKKDDLCEYVTNVSTQVYDRYSFHLDEWSFTILSSETNNNLIISTTLSSSPDYILDSLQLKSKMCLGEFTCTGTSTTRTIITV